LANNAQPNFYYQTAPTTNTAPIMNHPISQMHSKLNSASTVSCPNNNTNMQQTSQDLDKLTQQGSTILNEHTGSINNQQTLPTGVQSKATPQPLMHPTNQSRRVH
jgi:hypothetical protein